MKKELAVLIPKDKWYIVGTGPAEQVMLMDKLGAWHRFEGWAALSERDRKTFLPVSYATKSGAANKVNKLKMREFGRRPWGAMPPEPRVASGAEFEELLVGYTLAQM